MSKVVPYSGASASYLTSMIREDRRYKALRNEQARAEGARQLAKWRDDERRDGLSLLPELVSAYQDTIYAVLLRHNCIWVEMVSDSRAKHHSTCRQELMWFFHRMAAISLPKIASMLGGRDHTTILHGVRAHEKRISVGGKYAP